MKEAGVENVIVRIVLLITVEVWHAFEGNSDTFADFTLWSVGKQFIPWAILWIESCRSDPMFDIIIIWLFSNFRSWNPSSDCLSRRGTKPPIMPPMYSLHLRFFNCLTPMPPRLIGRMMCFCKKGDRGWKINLKAFGGHVTDFRIDLITFRKSSFSHVWAIT